MTDLGILGLLGAFVVAYALHAGVVLAVAWVVTRLGRRDEAFVERIWRAALWLPFATLALQSTAGLGPTLDWARPAPAVEATAHGVGPERSSPGEAWGHDGSFGDPRADASPLDGDLDLEGGELGAGLEQEPGVASDPAEAMLPVPLRARELLPPELDAVSPEPRSETVAPTSESGRNGTAVAADWFGQLLPLLGVGALLAAALGVARLGALRYRLSRLLVGRRPVTSGRLAIAWRHVAGPDAARIRLTVADSLSSPIAFGVLRREVCLPSRVDDELEGAALAALLAHEYAHHEHRDPLRLEVAHTLVALLPWHPLPHAARSRLRVAAEYRCDRRAAERVEPVAVAECLVEVAGWLRRPGNALGLVPGMAVQRDGLEQRVERLLATSGGAVGVRLGGGLRAGLAVLAIAGVALAVPRVESAPVASSPEAPAEAEGDVDAALPTVEPARSSDRDAPTARESTQDMPAVTEAAAAASLTELREVLDLVEIERSALATEVVRLRAEVAELARLEGRRDAQLDVLLAALTKQLELVHLRQERIRAQLDAGALGLLSTIEPDSGTDPAAGALPAGSRR